MSAAGLLPVAERHGVSFVEGSRFYVGGGGADHIRLSFSMLPANQLVTAAERLRTAMHERPRPH
jgi:DNA-binding transcriptional MocR family regulator